MNRYRDEKMIGGDDEGMMKDESEGESTADGLEIAMPENADTYRLLMGEDPETNPKVESFREAYDASMMENSDHSQCIEAGRKALQAMGRKGDKGEMEMMGGGGKGMDGMMGGGVNPLNG